MLVRDYAILAHHFNNQQIQIRTEHFFKDFIIRESKNQIIKQVSELFVLMELKPKNCRQLDQYEVKFIQMEHEDE